MKNKNDLKVMLLQIREDPQVKAEELQSFARYSGLNQEQFFVLNVFDNPSFAPEIIRNYDALFIGGASSASVLQPDKFPFMSSCIDLIHLCIKENIAVFASCFGFQVAVISLGGTIIKDDCDFEMGTPPVTLTKKAQTDPIFSGMPYSFPVVSVHQEKATSLPDNCQLLAYTDSCCHSFRVTGKPFWAFQFHPELDKQTLTKRLRIYQQKYTQDKNHLNDVINSIIETPESNSLVRKFVEYLLVH
ncbi:MAG: type 1 glutamine amidotransferase [Bacteriovoracaceae bacterium]|nr:type 1 glutamine amidotransferase [Bacteriovoracaceae bacterium]